jgi:hypothetical protein
MNSALEHVGWRIGRAKRQFEALRNDIVGFVNSDPYKVIFEADENALELRAVLERQMLMPPVWPVIVGEIAHNLHSALDHIVYQLVILETDEPSTNTRLAFPVFHTTAGYNKRGPEKLVGVGAKASALIKSLQPLPKEDGGTGEGTESPLWQLYQLSVWDKHKATATVVAAKPKDSSHGIQYVHQPGILGFSLFALEGPLNDKTLIGKVRFAPSDEPFHERVKQVKMQANFAFEVALQHPAAVSGKRLISVLNNCGSRVLEIAQRFDREVFG